MYIMKAEFVTIPALHIGRNGQWNLDSELVYESAILNQEVRVPKGYETDLSSIPRIFTPLIPKNGRHRPAAIVHDYLCREKVVDRVLADKVFLEAMRLLDVPRWRRGAMYAAVRILTFFIRKKK
jgi:hypothetical protein